MSASWLEACLEDRSGFAVPGEPSQIVVADVRWFLDGRDGRSDYESGHIPGAVWIDLDHSLAAAPSAASGRHPLPDPETFAEAMSDAGIGDATMVLAYDTTGGMTAGRLVWMLRSIGRRAALLDGGLASWRRPLEAGPASEPQPAPFTPVAWPPTRVATMEEVASGVGVLVDARAPERYSGEVEPVDAMAGHIPGAVNLPFSGNLGPDGRFKPAAELRERFAAAGAGPGSDLVAYCGSGVSACHDLLAFEAAGLGTGRLYPGSWSQWCATLGRAAFPDRR